jgi:hypothetical protein
MPERNSYSEETKLADDEEDMAVDRCHRRMASSRVWDFAFCGKLYGRAKEMDELQEVYRRIATPGSTKTELVLVSGGGGVGKVSYFQVLEGFIDSLNSAVSLEHYFQFGRSRSCVFYFIFFSRPRSPDRSERW